MKLHSASRLAFVWLFMFLVFSTVIQAQVPAPAESNVTGGIQITLDAPDGIIMVVPSLINKQTHLSWAHLLLGGGNLNALSWNDVSFSRNDSAYSPIVGIVNKQGGIGKQFYIIYQDGVIMQSTASVSGISAPVYVGRDTNYAQFAYTKLMGKNTLYMLMNNGQIDISRNGGQIWQWDTGGASLNSFVDLAVNSYQTAFAFYSPGGTVNLYKQEANSNTWNPISFPAGQLPFSLFIDRRNRIFVGTYGNGVYYSTDTGNTWTRSATNLNGAIVNAFSGFNDDAFGNVYMLTYGGAQLYRSTDSGANWTDISAPIKQHVADSNYLYVINSVAGDTVLTAYTLYGVFVSADQGNTWTAANSGLNETQFNGFYKTTTGRFVETSNNGLFYKDPSANSFTHVLPSSGYGYAGPVLSDTLGNIYTSTHKGPVSGTINFLWNSNDNGTSWQADTGGLLQVASAGSFAVDEYGNEHLSGSGPFGVTWLYKKTRGNNSFDLDTAGLKNGHVGPYYQVNSFMSDNNGSLYMGGGGNASLLTCWRRPITGGNWILDTAGLPGYNPITYLTREYNHNMIATTADGIYYHQLGSWHNVPLPVATGYLAVSAVATDNTGGIIASFMYSPPSYLYSYGYGIYCTHDYGTTWTEVGLKGVNVYGLYNFGDTTYALSDLGIYALTCNGISNPVAIIEIENGSVFSNMSLYPNPASNICHAVFSYSNLSSKTELVIADISGRVIKTIAIAQEINEASFNTSDMSNGIYFCVLKSDDVILEVKKLIVTQ